MELNEKKDEITETLHIPVLRRKWQILVLQITATASLLLLLKRMSDIYGPCSDEFIMNNNADTWCPSYEHTRGLMWMDNANGLLIPDFLLGVGQTGTMSMIGPIVLCVFATFAIERFWSSSQELQNRIKHRLQKDAFHNWRMAVSGAVIAAQERMSVDTGEIFENNLSNLSLENAELRKALLACQQDSEEAHRHGGMAQNQLQYILCKVADLGEVLSEIEGGGEALIAACSILEDVLKHHTTEATKLNDLVARKALASEAKGQGAEGASPRLSSWLMTPTGKG